MSIDLSIIICTYNRHEILARNILTIHRLGYDSDNYEILIIDNSDNESAANNFKEYLARSFPHIRYIYSMPPGLSIARNRGLHEAQAPLCAYLDDDAFPQEGWAEGIVAAFSRPDVDFVAGRIDLKWEGTRPRWLPKEYDEAFSAFNPARSSRYLRYAEYPVGANMAFRTNILKSTGGFNTSLGRIGQNLLSNEELELCERLAHNGCKGYYSAEARVIHHVPVERQSWEWIRRRMAWQGFSESSEPYETVMRWKEDACSTLHNGTLRDSFQSMLAQPTNAAEARERLIFARALGDVLFRSKWHTDTVTDQNAVPQDGDNQYMQSGIANLMIAEFCTHSYLYNGYGNDKTVPYLIPNKENWPTASELVLKTEEALRICAKHDIHALLFLTISPFWDLPSEEYERLNVSGIRLYGILHGDVPKIKEKIENALRLENYFEQFFVFHEECLADYASIPFIKTPSVLPHPPTLLINWNEYSRRKHPHQKVRLGFLGEFRPGKGYALTCELLCNAPEPIKHSIECIFCGGFRDHGLLEKLKRSLDLAGIRTEFYTKRINTDFHVIPDALFADAILNSDVILFPYHGEEKAAFSGAFIDGLVSGAIFLATKDSVMGRIINRNSLGFVFERDAPHSFYSALEKAVRAVSENSLADAKALFLHTYTRGRSTINIQDYLNIKE